MRKYFFALKSLGVINDGKGLEYFINEKIINNSEINKLNQTKYIAIVLGGSYYTKQIPIEDQLAHKKANGGEQHGSSESHEEAHH